MHPKARIVALLSIIAAGAGVTGAAPAIAETVVARPADGFVDSIGVNTHTTYNDTNYGNTAAVITALRNLGVRHIRETLEANRPDQYATLRSLAAAGVHATLIMGNPKRGKLNELVSTLASSVPAPDAVEGPNEWDLSGDLNWAADLRAYITEMHSQLAAQPALRQVRVIGPSLTSVDSFRRLGPVGSLVDATATHPYPWARVPEGAASAADAIASQGAPGKPIVVSESGYNNWLGASPLGIQPGVSERASAIYLPRLFLTNFASGIARTFSYELLDETLPPGIAEDERHYGLVRSDFAPKPGYRALQRIIGMLADPGPSFTPSSLAFTVTGDTGGVQKVLLERRDGTLELALWRAVPVWDTTRHVDLYPADLPLSLQLASGARWKAYRPSQTAVPTGRGSGRTITLPVGADVTLLELRGLTAQQAAASSNARLKLAPAHPTATHRRTTHRHRAHRHAAHRRASHHRARHHRVGHHRVRHHRVRHHRVRHHRVRHPRTVPRRAVHP